MADPIGKYVTLYKGTPDNQVNMSIANEVDWSSFGSSTWQEQEVRLDADHKPRVCHGSLNESNLKTYKTIWTGLGLARRPKEGFSLITDGSVYEVLMTVDSRAQANNRTMTAIPISVKPDDWDENYAVKYYESSVQPNSGDIRQAVYYPAKAPWSATTQYYTSDYASWWYVKSGNKMLRFGVGDIGLTSGGVPSVGVLNNTINLTQLTQSPMFWTWLHDDTETIIMNQFVNADYNFASYSSYSSGEPGTLFNQGQRWRYLFSPIYEDRNEDWNTAYYGDSTQAVNNRNQWRSKCRDKVRIRNTTCTQFGFVTKDGHRYFGIWVLVPTISYMIGFNKYDNEATDIPTRLTPTPISPSPHAYDDDLRIYNFDDPIPDTQSPEYLRIEFYGVEIDKIGITIEEKQGTRPPDINPDPTTSTGWTPLKPILPTQRSLGSLAGANEDGFHVWKINRATLQALQKDLWNWGSTTGNVQQEFQENGKIDNILSAMWTGITAPIKVGQGIFQAAKESKIDPLSAVQTCFSLPAYITPLTEGQRSYGPVKVAGIKVGTNNNIQGYCCLTETYTTTVTVSCTDLGVTDSYLDNAPYSTCEVYLPYIGCVQINPADCIGGRIEVTYSTCVIDGTVSATIYAYRSNADSFPTHYGPYTGNAAFRIPLAQKDANAFNRDMGYMSAIGTGIGGIFNVVKGSLSTLATSPRDQNAIMDQGKANISTYAKSSAAMIGKAVNSYLMPQVLRGSQIGTGGAIVCNTTEVAVIMSTPKPLYDDWDDSKLQGFPSGKVGPISGNSGLCTYTYANLQGITATAAEIEDIKSILGGGVYQ